MYLTGLVCVIIKFFEKNFMKLGFHISIAGGFKNVLARAKERNCETIQLFSRNPRAWKYSSLDREDIALFKEGMKKADISPIFVHMPYLANIASSDKHLFRRSVDSVVEDLTRSEIISAEFLIIHIGVNQNMAIGIRRMGDGINEAFSRVNNKVFLLLENTAGGGNEIGARFEQIRDIIAWVNNKKRIGVVFDTAHAFEAGYDLRTRAHVDKTLREFDRVIGLKNLYLIHLNDSKTKLGSHRDRHWHVAKGEIGKGMGYILNHPSLRNMPFIMETPRISSKEDIMNMRTVQSLLNKG